MRPHYDAAAWLPPEVAPSAAVAPLIWDAHGERTWERGRSPRGGSRAPVGRDHGYVGGRDLAALAIDVANVHRQVGTADPADIRLEMDTHFFGTLAVTRAFAPQLTAHDESAVLNVLSVLSWISAPGNGAYCAAKSAEWSLTNALRLELRPGGARVTALRVGYMGTAMTRHLDVPKSNPADIAKLAIDGVEAGDTEIVADEISQQVLAKLSAGVAGLYPQVA